MILSILKLPYPKGTWFCLPRLGDYHEKLTCSGFKKFTEIKHPEYNSCHHRLRTVCHAHDLRSRLDWCLLLSVLSQTFIMWKMPFQWRRSPEVPAWLLRASWPAASSPPILTAAASGMQALALLRWECHLVNSLHMSSLTWRIKRKLWMFAVLPTAYKLAADDLETKSSLNIPYSKLLFFSYVTVAQIWGRPVSEAFLSSSCLVTGNCMKILSFITILLSFENRSNIIISVWDVSLLLRSGVCYNYLLLLQNISYYEEQSLRISHH